MFTSAQQEGLVLVVEPESCLQDESVSIRASGLQPGQHVTFQAAMTDTRGVNFMSYAHYIADEQGAVDVGKMESKGGRYKGHFPMGLIGSLLPSSNDHKFTRFFKRDVENPNEVKVSIHEGHLSAEELCPPDPDPLLTSVTHLRHYMGPGVQRIPVRYGKVRGCLFLPQGAGPFPGVVDMFGTAGGLLEYRSAQLASRGFASLALAFFGYEDLPKSMEEFDISYFEEAVAFLLKHDKVLKHGVGVIGTSKGGDLALSVAAFIPTIRACVAINGCNAPLGVPIRVRNHVYQQIPALNVSSFCVDDEGVISMGKLSVHPNLFKDLALPIQKSNSAFLFLVSSDDQSMKSELYAQEAYKRLSENGHPRHYEVSSYPGTGHLLEPPYSPHCRASFQHSHMLVICWGGTSKFHILGQEKAWVKMINFLWHHLAEEYVSEPQKGLPIYDNQIKSNL